MVNNTNPCIYICIPIHNRIDYTLKCIESIKNQTYTNFLIVICDDGSNDNTSDIVSKKYPDVILLNADGNLWWTGATNKCVEYALERGDDNDYVYTLNNDTELFPNTLASLIEISKTNNNAIIGTLNVFYDNINYVENSAFIKKSVFGFSRVNKFGEELKINETLLRVDALSGKGVLIPFSVFKNIGLYDFAKLPHYHADFEFTFRANHNGYPVYLSYITKLKSHQYLSGIGSVTSKPNILEFISSFKSIKSTHHLQSLINMHKLVYGKSYLMYLFISLIFIHLGFIKRLIKFKLS